MTGKKAGVQGKVKSDFHWKKKKTEILERSLVEKTGTRRGWVLRGYQSRLRRRQQDKEVRFCWGFTADRVLRRYRNKGEVRSMYLTVEEWIRVLSCSPLFSADGFFCDLSEFMTLVAVCMYVIYCLIAAVIRGIYRLSEDFLDILSIWNQNPLFTLDLSDFDTVLLRTNWRHEFRFFFPHWPKPVDYDSFDKISKKNYSQ